MNWKKVVVTFLTFAAVMAVSAVAFAAPDVSPETATMAHAEIAKWAALASALSIGVAAFGGALGQGKAAAAALDGIARNPTAADKLFTPMILGLALIESLVIYALIISFVLSAKV